MRIATTTTPPLLRSLYSLLMASILWLGVNSPPIQTATWSVVSGQCAEGSLAAEQVESSLG